MSEIIRYLTHPQVLVDPDMPVPDWSLNATGAARVAVLAAQPGVLAGTRLVVSSAEVKALETARPLAKALDATLLIRPEMHENDRSATGFLPPAEFEHVADRFFATPDDSVRGWETARHAQARILRAVEACVAEAPAGDILFVGHGGVGTLLYCALAGLPISRAFDQGAGGGGCWFGFDRVRRVPFHGWKLMETLSVG